MSFEALVVNIMIASPGDVAKERESIRQIIHRWNAVHAEHSQLVLLPLGWESHASPLLGDRAQAIINRQVLESCDLLVAVFWTRLGSPTGDSESGTVEEIKKHLSKGKPAMIYFSDTPISPSQIDSEQRRALQDFRKECEQRGLVETYCSAEEFQDKFSRHLAHTIIREFDHLRMQRDKTGQSARPNQSSQLSAEALQLLMEGSQDGDGTILCVPAMEGLILKTNGKTLTEVGNRREEAKWQAAIHQLETIEMIEPLSPERRVFQITHDGYQAADRLRQQRNDSENASDRPE